MHLDWLTRKIGQRWIFPRGNVWTRNYSAETHLQYTIWERVFQLCELVYVQNVPTLWDSSVASWESFFKMTEESFGTSWTERVSSFVWKMQEWQTMTGQMLFEVMGMKSDKMAILFSTQALAVFRGCRSKITWESTRAVAAFNDDNYI